MRSSAFCILTLCLCNVIKLSVGDFEHIEVQTSLGPIRGKLVYDDITTATYYSFEGIPFAEPPVGSLRFQAPVRKSPWSTPFYATRPGNVCPQAEYYHKEEEMNEDCLCFNVYVPVDSWNKSLPVIFSIHSGDFNLQSGKATPIYGPELLILNNVVVVTVNHRLGALGFLSFFTEKVPGNAGVKDAILALKIVHENISKFSGDPKKITIRGSGAGAVMTELFMLTEQTSGLFQSVMVHCGSVLSTKYMQVNPRDNAKALTDELGIAWTTDDNVLEELKYMDAYDIIKAQEAISKRDPRRGFLTYRPFKPCVETAHEGAVLIKSPFDLMSEGAIQDVVTYIGYNDQEGLEQMPIITKEPGLLDKIDKNLGLVIPDDIKYPEGSTERNNLIAQIRNFYLNGGKVSLANIQGYLNLIADTQYTFSIDQFVKLYTAKKKSNVFYYVFGSDTELNWFKAYENITYHGAAHDDNTGYSFLTSVTRPKYKALSPTDKKTQKNVLGNIEYFSTNGSPPPNPNPWPSAGQERYHTVLNNNGSTQVSQAPNADRTGFWTSVYEQYKQYTLNPTPTQPTPTVTKPVDGNTPVKGLIPAVLDLVTGTLTGLLG